MQTNGHANVAAAQQETRASNGDKAPTLTNHPNNHTIHTKIKMEERLDEVVDMEVEAAAGEDAAEEKKHHTETSSRDLIISTIATRAAMTATTRATNAPKPTEASTCQTSNEMRHTSMPTKERAW
jgi:hypothetical protein